MKSTSLKNRALQLAAMFMVLIAGLSFMSCASESGEDDEASPIVGTWRAQASSKGTYFMVCTEYRQYFFTSDIHNNSKITEEGKYTFSNNTLTFTPKGGAQKTYTCFFKGDNLRLTPTSGNGGELDFIRHTDKGTKSVKRVKR